MKKWIFSSLILMLVAVNANAKDKVTVKYKKGKKINFESLLIEGEQKKPEMSVVTGNIGEKDLGLLKLRKNFNDYMANDAGEKIQ